MKRITTIIVTAAMASGVLAGTALGDNPDNPNNAAAKACQAEKREMGNKAFKESYGGKHAMQQCKRKYRAGAEAVAPVS